MNESKTNEFLKKANATINIKFVGLAVNKDFKEKDKRNLYEITLSTPCGSMVFDFWDSIRNTEIKQMSLETYIEKYYRRRIDSLNYAEKMKAQRELNAKKAAAYPNAYDVLACMTKYDYGTFENYCSEFAYDEDSRTAERIYFAAQKEYLQLARIFTQEQLEEMQEIK